MSATTSSAVPTSTGNSGNQSGGGGGPNSPLLFFVALGFGVVFTNLWIIVGVKYCFRYNQRNRARLAGEDPDAVDLNAVPRQRRRREKKLMTIDDVNERFPLVKYKTWRSTRADQGLPTAGGITNAPSRPASIRHQVRDVADEIELQEKEPKTPTKSIMTEKTVEHGTPQQISEETHATGSANPPTANKSVIIATPEPALVRATSNDGETEDVDRIQIAIPAEQLPDPGDTCAICIDTIEDDDDIRGLTCGHAFHASCVDPWLTSRRACCPLCKADYYVPKPRPEGTQEEPRRASRLDGGPQVPFALMPGRPGYRHHNGFSLSRAFLGHQPNRIERNRPEQTETRASAPEVSEADPNSRSWRERLPGVRLPTVPALSRIRRGRNTEAGEQPAEAPTTTPTPTPAQLEAGRT